MGKKKTNDQQQQFYISQIETTKIIIKKFSTTKEFSPAMLLNSLLSLVVLPFENAKKKDTERVFPGKFQDMLHSIAITPVCFSPIKGCSKGDVEYQNKTTYAFINKFRNGIAHQNLTVNVDESKMIHIIIYNKFTCQSCKSCKSKKCEEKGLKKLGNGVIDFQINVTVNELQKLALYIADAYLKAIK